MARLAAILAAVARGILRESRSLLPVRGNNLILALLLVGPGAGFVLLLLGGLLLIPLVGDPVSRIPRERLALWPLTERERWMLRAAGLGLSPLTWIAVAAVVWKAGWQLGVGAVLLLALAPLLTREAAWIPRWPRATGFVTKHLRDLLTLFDTWVAVLLATSAHIALRVWPGIDQAMPFVLALVIVLALSTLALNQFGMGHPETLTREQLLPCPAWQIILGRNVAFLMVALVCVVPLSPLAGCAAALAAVAAGNVASFAAPIALRRWRLAESGSMVVGVQQCVALLAAGVMTERTTWWTLPVVMLLWIGSVLVAAWQFPRTGES